MFHYVADAGAGVVSTLWGLPKEAIVPLLLGILRKEMGAGMFAPLALTTKQLVSGCVILSMFFPCIATLVVLLRELGWKDTLKATGIMLAAVVATRSRDQLHLAVRLAAKPARRNVSANSPEDVVELLDGNRLHSLAESRELGRLAGDAAHDERGCFVAFDVLCESRERLCHIGHRRSCGLCFEQGERPPAERHEEVHLEPLLVAEVIERPLPSGVDLILRDFCGDESLEYGSEKRRLTERSLGAQPEQMAREPRIDEIDFGRLDEPLPEVLEEGGAPEGSGR